MCGSSKLLKAQFIEPKQKHLVSVTKIFNTLHAWWRRPWKCKLVTLKTFIYFLQEYQKLLHLNFFWISKFELYPIFWPHLTTSSHWEKPVLIFDCLNSIMLVTIVGAEPTPCIWQMKAKTTPLRPYLSYMHAV